MGIKYRIDKDTQLSITQKSFGMYFRYGLPKLGLTTVKIQKGGYNKENYKAKKQGYVNYVCYFGLNIKVNLPKIKYL